MYRGRLQNSPEGGEKGVGTRPYSEVLSVFSSDEINFLSVSQHCKLWIIDVKVWGLPIYLQYRVV